MVFTKRLREGIRRGRIRCSVRIWQSPRVKAGGRYRMDDGHIVVDAIEPMALKAITDDLARESGFDSVDDLLKIARHGSGEFPRRSDGRVDPLWLVAHPENGLSAYMKANLGSTVW